MNIIFSIKTFDLLDTIIAFQLRIDATFFNITPSHIPIIAIFLLEIVE
jgi:hypothetical protein